MKTNKTTTTVIPTTMFEQQVLNFCKTAAEPIVQLYRQEDEYGTDVGKTLTKLLSSYSALGVDIAIVQEPDTSSDDTQGSYRDTSIILKFTDTSNQVAHVKINCDLSSYGGLEYCNHRIVKPITKTVQVFE